MATSTGEGIVRCRTLVIGDSFGYYSLTGLRPFIADGTFLWTGHVPREQMIAEIVSSDTVILEIVQRTGSGGLLTSTKLIADIQAALARAPK